MAQGIQPIYGQQLSITTECSTLAQIAAGVLAVDDYVRVQEIAPFPVNALYFVSFASTPLLRIHVLDAFGHDASWYFKGSASGADLIIPVPVSEILFIRQIDGSALVGTSSLSLAMQVTALGG